MTKVPVRVPGVVMAPSDEFWRPLCEYLEEQGIVEDSTLIKAISLDSHADDGVTVTSVTEVIKKPNHELIERTYTFNEPSSEGGESDD